jgi:hypothetical protein
MNRPAEGEVALQEILQTTQYTRHLLDNMLGDRRWTVRGNARLDPLSDRDYRNLALGLGRPKTLADIESGDYAMPVASIVRAMLTLRDPLEVILPRAHASLIRSVEFREVRGKPDAPWTVSYIEEDQEYDENGDPYINVHD